METVRFVKGPRAPGTPADIPRHIEHTAASSGRLGAQTTSIANTRAEQAAGAPDSWRRAPLTGWAPCHSRRLVNHRKARGRRPDFFFLRRVDVPQCTDLCFSEAARPGPRRPSTTNRSSGAGVVGRASIRRRTVACRNAWAVEDEDEPRGGDEKTSPPKLARESERPYRLSRLVISGRDDWTSNPFGENLGRTQPVVRRLKTRFPGLGHPGYVAWESQLEESCSSHRVPK